VSQTNAYHRAGDLLFGSWPRTIAVLLLALLVFAAVAWAAISGSFAHPDTWNIPGIHPYPPAGQVQNPFGSQAGLISASEAGIVKADLLRDGQIELNALKTGDAAPLNQSTTGGALTKLRQLILQNNSNGIVEREQIHLDSVIVGRLPDPNARSVSWCVEERGSGTPSPGLELPASLQGGVTEMGSEELDVSSEAKEDRTRRVAQWICLESISTASTEKVMSSKPPAVIGPQLKRRLGLPFAGVAPTVTATASDAMPLAITSSTAGPIPI